MKQLANFRGRAHGVSWDVRLASAAIFVVFALAVAATAGFVLSSQVVQASPGALTGFEGGDAQFMPAAQQTFVPPVQTGQVPAPVVTAGTGVGDGNNPADAPGANPQGTTQGDGDGFPWWILGVLALVLLGGVVLAMAARSRRETVVTEYAAAPTPGAGRGAYTGPALQAAQTSVPASMAASMAAAPVAVAGPTTMECPNCSTANNISENFCHECGQDLRATRTQLLAAAAPPPVVDEVTEDTPYLETLDRSDEQLEYVLSRPLVVIGTAAGNDITIDSTFRGWQTVSAQHAELRREQDGFTITDRGSENGTFVNELRTGESLLADGDTIRVGDVRFVFRIPRND